ncbi:MAG: glycosyl hydrolase family 8 [Patescibacteria group bacterium]
MSRKTWGIFLLVGAFLILGFVAYKNSPKRQVPIIFSPRTELLTLWEAYKQEYIEKGSFRVLDKQKDSITTSEGQSYAMLRAVWLDDKPTFDGVWKFTKDNLQHKEGDKLFAWLFGKQPDGSYGIMTSQGGQNSATDADTDIALALIFASARWNNQDYLNEAKLILDSVWAHEVVDIKGRPYLVANNLEKNSPTTMVVNPSYFSPYAYRVFAKVDPTHNWMGLVDTSYEVLEKSMAAPLDQTKSANIPPDWIFLDKTNGAILPPKAENLSTNFGYDALRTPWRIALDWQWFEEPRAKALLTDMKFLSEQWNSNSVLYVPYKHNGEPAEKHQSAAFYGGTIGYFMVADPENAKVIYDNKLQVLYNPDTNSWKVKLGYYDDNWVWFGIALYNNLLPNLAAN